MVNVRRGDIWLIQLDPAVGSEIQKSRPCVIISPPEMHDFIRTVLVAPMTTGARAAPYRIALTFDKRKGLILLDQMRSIDQVRLVKKLGKTTVRTLDDALAALQAMFAP
jgi:mRNA interferase MazF